MKSTKKPERKTHVQRLRQYEHIVSSTPDFMAFIDRNYTYQVVNDSYLKAFNKRREEIVDHTMAELFGNEFFENVQKKVFDSALTGQVTQYEAWFDLPAYGRCYLVVNYNPLYESDGTVSGVVVSARDITERKRTMELERKKSMLSLQYKETLLALSQQRFDDVHDYFHAITEAGSRALNVERVSIWTLHGNTIECQDQFLASTGEHQHGVTFTLSDTSPYLTALKRQEVIRADDSRTDPRTCEFNATLLEPMDIHSMMDVPIWSGGRMVGVMCNEHTGARRQWTDAEEDFATHLASIGSVAMEANKRRMAQIELQRTAEAVATGVGEQFLRRLVQTAAEVLKMEYCFIGLLDRDGLHVNTIANCVNGELRDNFTYELRGTPCEDITLHGECIFPAEVQKQFPADPYLVKMQIEAYAGVPLSNSTGRIIGLITAFTRHPIKNAEHSLNLLRIFAARAAHELERQEHETNLRESEAHTRLIVETALDAVIGMNADGRITMWNRQAEQIFGWTANEAVGQPLVQLIIPEELREAHIRGLAHFHATGEGPVLNKRIEITGLHRDGHVFPIELAVSPLRIGSVWSFSAFLRDITERKRIETELRHANELLQNQLAEIEALQDELREQSIRDPLTGLFNRRYLDETLRRELSRARRENSPLSLALLDIDYFKPLNDSYGHDAGDVMLQSMAILLRTHTRSEDVVCRYGGEEFVVVLPATALENAQQRMEQLRCVLEQLRVPFNQVELHTTVSIGIAAFPVHGKTDMQILRAADMALYEAKGAGRNRVIVCA